MAIQLHTTLTTLGACFILQALAAQIPLGFSSIESGPSPELEQISEPYSADSHLDSESSNLNLSLWHPPLANATGHLVFETVNSLLQHWPNTRYRNGHTIVPGVIPKGTLLYHGARSDKIPTVPEWTATDPEHSTIFCRGPFEAGCWHLTLATTRPLKVLYFDGTSAANGVNGTLDTQEIIAWGGLRPDRWREEAQRLEDLCRWGAPYAVDGYVRMEMDFEVMLCDFTAGVEVVSFSHLASLTPVSEMPRDSLPNSFEVMHAGSWHNRYPGETRINLDLAGIVSLYDTTLVPSLVGLRAGQERCDHRVHGISTADIERVRKSVSLALERSQDDRSGVDWKTLFRVIVDRYSDRFELMNHLLNTTLEGDALMNQARKVHIQLRVMLTPYIFHNTTPPNGSFVPAHSWATPVFRACGTTHTSSIASYMSSLNPSERVLLRALQETTHEICRITTKMWAAGVHAGLDPYLPADSTSNAAEIGRMIDSWRQQLSDLREWLDWSVWVKCHPACGPEEMCYLPTWPVNMPGRRSHRYEPSDNSSIFSTSFAEKVYFKHSFFMELVDPQDEDGWRKPKPKCVRRVQPYGL